MAHSMLRHLVQELLGSGMTQAQIAESVGCHQTTVHRIATDKTAAPSYDLGMRIVDIAKKRGLMVTAGAPAPTEEACDAA